MASSSDGRGIMARINRARLGVTPVLLAVAAVATVGAGVWQAAVPVDAAGLGESTAMSALLDVGRSVRADVRRVVAPAADRMGKLAVDPGVIAALRDGSPAAETAACNRAVASATEIDALAMYNAAGDIVAINTVDAAGRPVPIERVHRIPGLDPVARAAGGPCLHNFSRFATLEFQTTCHIAPALFDSAGLSVAYSVPVVDPPTGKRLGVISCRVRSDRMSDLTRGRSLAGSGGAVEFVTDKGQYFSEAIQSGRTRAPVDPAAVASLVAPLVAGGADDSVVRHGGDYLGLFRLNGFTTTAGGGIQVLLLAKPAWLAREASQGRLLRAGGLVAGGLLLGLVAALAGALTSVRRLQAGTSEAAQRLDLAMDAGGFGAWDLHLPTHRLIVDERFAAFVGVPLADLPKDRSAWLDRVHPDDLAGAQAAVDDHLAGRTAAYRHEHRVRHADGSWRWNLATGRVVERSADGTPVRLVGTFADVTARRATEAELAEAGRRAASERLAASRAAGMAEVATGVLHNVGNVLNSVNVSAELIRDRVRGDAAVNLGRAVALIDRHRDDLGTYLTADAKGRQLPTYLGAVAATLADERSAVLSELASLTRGVDHIKQIVHMQQESARQPAGSTFREPVRPADVVDDALRFNQLSLAGHRITVRREVADGLPAVDLDRHKTLQILVNLIANAKEAVKAVADGDRREVTVRVSAGPGSDGRPAVRFVVADTGCGIAPDHLARLFHHGFTTRPGGHGFGLHSSANAAREMGGQLTAASDGPGHGATFTLEVPAAGTGAGFGSEARAA